MPERPSNTKACVIEGFVREDCESGFLLDLIVEEVEALSSKLPTTTFFEFSTFLFLRRRDRKFLLFGS
jgi:hypothetical protein